MGKPAAKHPNRGRASEGSQGHREIAWTLLTLLLLTVRALCGIATPDDR
jgi:hypothetical protein